MNHPKTEIGMWRPEIHPQLVALVRPPSTAILEHHRHSASSSAVSAFPHAMSLLTPSESRAFQSFLEATAFPLDQWNMQFEISHEHMPPAHGTEALTKKTKDLMSLDSDKWRLPLSPFAAPEGSVPRQQQQTQTNPLTLLYSATQQRSPSSYADNAELMNPSAMHPKSLTHLPSYHVIHAIADDRSSSSSSSRQSPVDLMMASSSSAKRSPPPDAKSSNKRHRLASQNAPDEALIPPQHRASLLSPSQKKANHIQSEQKRRANIRRGYDTLCETVPALREACQAEDEQLVADGKSKGRRKGKAKAKSDDGEKIDGRAGPRSENVVLSKTIDYIQELLSEREALMQRLHAARSALPANHPLLQTQPGAPPPPWERKWTGGEGKGHDDDDDDDDEE